MRTWIRAAGRMLCSSLTGARAGLAHRRPPAEASAAVSTTRAARSLPGATVVATSPSVAGVFRVVSDEAGNYRLTDLPPADDYTVTAESPGFSKYERTGLIVRAGLNVRLDVSLNVGNLTQSVEVTGNG